MLRRALVSGSACTSVAAFKYPVICSEEKKQPELFSIITDFFEFDPKHKLSKTALGPTISEVPKVHHYMMDLLYTYRLSDHQKLLVTEVDALPRSQMAGSQDEAQFLSFLCEILDAKKVLEVGVFRGSTTLALALGLPNDGKVVGLDISEEYTHIGRKYWIAAGVEHKVDLMIGDATKSMETLLCKGEAGTFDLVFIDADKSNYMVYYEIGLQLLRPGGIVAIDNTLWHGKVLQPEEDRDGDTKAICAINEFVHKDTRVSITMLSIADGLTLCRKL